jgi:hypothetical protein
MEHRGWFSSSEALSMCTCPQPDESGSCHLILFLWDSLISSSHLPFALFHCHLLIRTLSVLWHACHIWVSELTFNLNIKHLESHNPYSWESDLIWTYKQNLFQLLLYSALIRCVGRSERKVPNFVPLKVMMQHSVTLVYISKLFPRPVNKLFH